MEMNQKNFINEEVASIEFHRYKYIERDSTRTCSLCALRYVCHTGEIRGSCAAPGKINQSALFSDSM